MRIATLALCLAGASAFVGPAAPRRLPLRRRAVAELVATGEALVRSQALAGELGAPAAVLEALPSSDVVVAFADQGGNLAGKFFMGSLPPYALFLYFLNYEGNNAPPLVRFGFAYLLLFVAATIPTGIIAKTTWGVSLADADWLHGGAESLLTARVLGVAFPSPRPSSRRPTATRRTCSSNGDRAAVAAFVFAGAASRLAVPPLASRSPPRLGRRERRQRFARE
ncbi:hypothetical protein JL720_13113 [Aureococcus anophagefferens]|nr:hypothetical protein JL720_13113 [Aureococcus anophagefferens]